MTKSSIPSPYGQIPSGPPPQLPPKVGYGMQPMQPQYQTQQPMMQPTYQTQPNMMQPQYQTQQPIQQQYRTQPNNQPQYQTQPQPQYQQTQQPNNRWYGGYAQQLQQNEVQQLRDWFQRVDTDRSGSIDANELQKVTFGGIPIGYVVAQKLIQVFDENRNGTIDFNEYCTMHRFISQMRQAFTNADADRSGRIEANEIYRALNGAGFSYLSPVSVNELTAKYDKTRKGLDWQEFLLMSACIAHVRSVFQWNDKQNTGTITLNIDQLTQIAAYLY